MQYLKTISTVIKYILLFPFLWINEWLQYVLAILKWSKHKQFIWVDFHLLMKYLFLTPYRICLKHLSQYPATDVQYGYGETFFTSMEKLLKTVHLSHEDTFYELGCGRGRLAFFIRIVYGCKVIAIDLTPKFITIANQLVKSHQLDHIDFIETNIMDYDYKAASVVYIYGTEFSLEARTKLVSTLKSLPEGARVISITHPLHQLPKGERFKLIDEQTVWFTWGKTPAFVYLVQNNNSATVV